MTVPAREPRHYAKPIVLPDSLSSLRGQATGIVRLPRHLKWSGSNRYDLDQPGRIIGLYRTVINEAMSPEDLATFLSQEALLGLWATIWLPPRIRAAWEQRFPELARLRETGKAAMNPMEPRHQRIAEIALAAGERYGSPWPADTPSGSTAWGIGQVPTSTSSPTGASAPTSPLH